MVDGLPAGKNGIYGLFEILDLYESRALCHLAPGKSTGL